MSLPVKTLAVIGAVAVLGTAVAFWTPLSSYVRTAGGQLGDAARDAVPTAFEIERISTLIGDLDQVIAEQQARLVAQQLDLEYLDGEVQRCREQTGHLTAEVVEARRLLGMQQASYRIGERDYDAAAVEREAIAKAERLQRIRDIAEAKDSTAQTLRQALASAAAQLEQARQQRESYRLRLSELQAKAETVAIRQELVVSLDRLPGAIDGGAFQEVETAFARIEKDLAVQDRLLDEQFRAAPAAEAISFTARPTQDVLQVLDRALGAPAVATEAVPTVLVKGR